MISIENIIFPNKPLNNFELEDAVKKLKIPNFRGVFLLDTLPKKLNKKECGIVNFDKSGGPGTHWVAWYKDGKTKIYFDSYGVQPPIEVINYLGKLIYYNTDKVQPAGQVFCGHLCLYVLKELSMGHKFQNILNKFFKHIKNMPVDKFGRMSDTKTKDTGVPLTYINNNYIRSDGTTPVSGSIDMRGNTLYNVPDPVNPQDVATKEYADKKTNIIAVSTSYCGNLYKGDYQFSFGGNTCKTVGFLMPHPGRIKKIKIRMGGRLIFDYEILNKQPYIEPIEKVKLDVFTIMLFKKDGFLNPNQNSEGSILGTCKYSLFEGITYSLKNHSLSEGDYINIRSERMQENNIKEEEFSFLFTFLIELDPL